jgi:hypothetical protein
VGFQARALGRLLLLADSLTPTTWWERLLRLVTKGDYPDAGTSQEAIPVGGICEGADGAKKSQPFGEAAVGLRKRGLAVVRCVGPDGKEARFPGWQRARLSVGTIADLARRYPDANVGVACGLSGYVVVDVDAPVLLGPMLERFGDTPLITRTPRGGAHLWYRKVGVMPSRNLKSEGLMVDIKADGGMVIVPPSYNRHSGKPYVFERGSWEDLDHLPSFRSEALAAAPSKENDGVSGSIREGLRNPVLHRHLLRVAPHVDGIEALLLEARDYNQRTCSSPLPDYEVMKTARSAWKCQVESRNWVGSQGQVRWPVDQMMSRTWHRNAGDAFILTMLLRAKHASRTEPFAVAARAIAAKNVIPGWTEHRIRQALRAALELKLIEQVHRGGRRQGDSSFYRLVCV